MPYEELISVDFSDDLYLRYVSETDGKTLNSDGTNVTYDADDLEDYAIALAQDATTRGRYTYTPPTPVTPASYRRLLYRKFETGVLDPLQDVGLGELQPRLYSGSAWLNAYSTLYGVMPVILWAYSQRTLTQSSTQSSSADDDTALIVWRGDSMSLSIAGLGDLSARTGPKLWFTVKDSRADADADAVMQLTEHDGLLVIEGEEATAGFGSITVDDVEAGNVIVALSPAMTALLSSRTDAIYDVQVYESGRVRTLRSGSFSVLADVTRSTS